MNAGDRRTLELIQQGTRGSRALLRTLARRGKALQRDDAARADLLLASIRPHPLYKGGRLTFDMLEMEDLILDPMPSDPEETVDIVQVLSSTEGNARDLVQLLLRIGSPRPVAPPADHRAADGLPRVRLGPPDANSTAAMDGNGRPSELPELVSSDYLYDQVVLGFLDALVEVVNRGSREIS